MAKYCSNCGKELNENADICLGCGVLVNKEGKKAPNDINNKKKGFPVWAIVLIIVGFFILIPLIIIILVVIFAFNTVKDNGSEYLDKAKDYLNDYMEDYSIIEEGTIGDVLEIDGIKFTLKNALKYDSIGNNIPKEGKEYLVFFFDVENTSNDEKLVTYLNFNGLVDDEKCMPKIIFDEVDGVNNLNKELKEGETIRGYIVFEIEKDWENFDLTYRKLLDDKGITFYVTNEKDNDNLEI